MVRSLLAVASAVLFAPALAHALPRPELTLVALHPVRVHGTGFKPRSQVRLTTRAGSQITRSTAAADRDGTFAATLGGVTVARCESLVVTAADTGGRRAVLRRFPKCPVKGRSRRAAPPSTAWIR
jgi:hypothetical protein